MKAKFEKAEPVESLVELESIIKHKNYVKIRDHTVHSAFIDHMTFQVVRGFIKTRSLYRVKEIGDGCSESASAASLQHYAESSPGGQRTARPGDRAGNASPTAQCGLERLGQERTDRLPVQRHLFEIL